MARVTHQCPQCGVSVATSKKGPEFRCPCCEATTVLLGEERTRKGERGDLVHRQELDLSRFTIDKQGTELFFSWPWSRGKGILGIVLATVLLGVAGGGVFAGPDDWWETVSSLDFSNIVTHDLFDLFFIFGPLLMFLGLLHASLCCLFNRTEIAFGNRGLRVWHGPIPAQRSTQMGLEELDQFRVERIVKQVEDNTEVTWELHAVRRRGKVDKLIKHEESSQLPKAVKLLLDAHYAAICPSNSINERVEFASPHEEIEESEPGDRVTLVCPKCAGILTPPPERAELSCQFCGADVPVPTAVQQQLGLDKPRRHSKKRLLSTFTYERRGETLHFGANWDRGLVGQLMLLGLVPFAIGVVGGIIAFNFRAPFFVYAILSLPTGAGLAMVYIAVSYAFNRTEVTVDSATLRIWHGPLPWRQPRPLVKSQLTQFVVRKTSYWNASDQSDIRWDLLALSHYGSNQTVFAEIKDREALETVEYLVEKKFGIVDQAVRG